MVNCMVNPLLNHRDARPTLFVAFLLDALLEGFDADASRISANGYGEKIVETVRGDDVDCVVCGKGEANAGRKFWPCGDGLFKGTQGWNRMAKDALEPKVNRGLVRDFPRNARGEGMQLVLELGVAFLRKVGVKIGNIHVGQRRGGREPVQCVPHEVTHRACADAPRAEI